MIEEKSVQRIGAVKAKPVNFRLIAATNRDLRAMVQEGTFREDLYYRLHVIRSASTTSPRAAAVIRDHDYPHHPRRICKMIPGRSFSARYFLC